MIRILIVNLGLKISMLKNLLKNNYLLFEFNYKKFNYNFDNIDGIFISNGPGNPELYYKYKNFFLYILFYKIPILSICLGHQIISILSRFEIYKLKIGHHSSNHSIFNKNNNKLYINTQNHNFNIKNSKKKYFILNNLSLLDYNVQNIISMIQPILSVQNHPEGCSGSNDFNFLFKYYNSICKKKF